jgi:hypothetical protein
VESPVDEGAGVHKIGGALGHVVVLPKIKVKRRRIQEARFLFLVITQFGIEEGWEKLEFKSNKYVNWLKTRNR